MRQGLTGHFSPMTSRDAAFIYQDRPGHEETLVGCYTFDAATGTPSTESVAALEKWMRPRLGAAPFLTSTVRRQPFDLGLPIWVPATHMNLADHLHVHEITGGPAELRRKLADIAEGSVELTRPPWELHAINGARGVEGVDAVTTVVLKVHHCAADGMGFRTLESTLFSADPDAAIGAPRKAPHPVESMARGVLNAPGKTLRFVRHARRTSADMDEVTRLEQEQDGLVPRKDRPFTRLNRQRTGRTGIAVTSFALADLRAARNRVEGATVNDVLLTIVGRALHRQLTDLGEPPSGSLAAYVPISLQIPDTRSGKARADEYTHLSATKLVIGIVDLHSDLEDATGRLAAVSAAAQTEKLRWMSESVRNARSRVDEAPAPLLALQGWIHRNRTPEESAGRWKRNTMISNLPAPAGEPELDGARLVTCFGILPPLDGDRLRHLFTTGRDRVNLCVSSDDSVLPDLDAYLAGIHEELRSLLGARRTRDGSGERRDQPDLGV